MRESRGDRWDYPFVPGLAAQRAKWTSDRMSFRLYAALSLMGSRALSGTIFKSGGTARMAYSEVGTAGPGLWPPGDFGGG